MLCLSVFELYSPWVLLKILSSQQDARMNWFNSNLFDIKVEK